MWSNREPCQHFRSRTAALTGVTARTAPNLPHLGRRDNQKMPRLVPKFTRSSLVIAQFALVVLVWMYPVQGSSSNIQPHSLPSLSVTANIPAAEMNALYDLYITNNGNGWIWRKNAQAGIPWNFSDIAINNPCVDHWQGIHCSFTSPFEYYHVANVSLPLYNLTGIIPSTFTSLSQLQYLELDGNHLTGSIPELLGNLTQLHHLSLRRNQIHGTIPASVGKLTQLQYLSLYFNRITGTIPELFGNLTQLQHLDLSRNLLSDTIPKSLGNMTQLQYLSVSLNNLVGTTPESLQFMAQLQYLDVSENSINGTLPESLGNLLQLQTLDFSENKISGTMPESLSKLVHLKYLYLYFNEITGSVPKSLGNLSQLQDFILYDNYMSGTIPESLGLLAQVQNLELDSNSLLGAIPESFGALSQLQYLGLTSNQLYGSIPASLGNLTQLAYLYMYSNQLTGTIPAALGKLTQLQDLELYDNYLSGFIPSSLGNLTLLVNLDLYRNQLSDVIPESLGNLTQLQSLLLYDNCLRGTLPGFLGNLTQLQSLLLYNNLFSGTLSCALGKLTQLQVLDLSSNQFHGTIPESLRNLTRLHQLILSGNQLTGTISVSLCSLPLLRFFILSNNQLTGTIPHMDSPVLEQLQLANNVLHGIVPSLKRLVSLTVLLLNNNKLVGSLENVFDPTIQLQVETIVVANNQLTGTLPKEVFLLQLVNFVGTSNCFEGPLPIEAICNNQEMVSFVIDGLSSASSCRNRLFSGILSAYSLEHAIGGSIPTCLFQLPDLATLHLSGNGFTGSIPNNMLLSRSLTDLSLSHNALTGSIPSQIQLKDWSNIDLSYNRLSGTLRSNFASNGTVEFENNRISGTVPASFASLVNLSVLASNTFSCRYDQSDLPEHDPDREQYHCGSNSFDILYYLWLGGAASAGILWLCYYRTIQKAVHSSISRVVLDDTNLYNTLSTICRLSLCCALYSLIVLLPLYAICSVAYGTQTYAYAYQVSAVYMSGIVPFALDWSFWWVLLISFNAMLLYVPSIAGTTRNKITDHKQVPPSTLWQSAQTVVPYIMIDCIVVAGVNAAYVYVAVYKSSSLLLVVQTLLSIFKVVWGRWALPYLLDVLTRHNADVKVRIFMQIGVNLLNNIAIPCLIVAVVSPDCFYNALVAAPAVTSTILYRQCIEFGFERICGEYESIPLVTNFQAPLLYNYQCSSSLVTYYAPAFVSMCIVSTFVAPLAQYVCRFLLSRVTPGTCWYRLLDSSLPRLAKPMQDTAAVSNRGYLNSCGLFTTLISTLGLVLTFGVMFPPLCVAFTVSICAMAFFFRYNVGRFISSSTQQGSQTTVVDTIKAECNSVDGMRILKDSVWLLITVSCWFYTLFLFDTLGDAVGFEGAYWVLIVMPLMPLVLYALCHVVCKYYPSSFMRRHYTGKERGEINGVGESVAVEVEMQTIAGNVDETDVHNILIVEKTSITEEPV